MFLVTDLDSRKDISHEGCHGDFVVLISCFGQVIRDKSERESVRESIRRSQVVS
jgi:hypothetical protein